MKKAKILKMILVPTLGISALGTVAAVATSCGEIKVQRVELNKDYTALGLGDRETLIANVFPQNATNKEVT
jgi:uncharacterized protein YjdB